MGNKVKDIGDGMFSFYCPGCKHEHIYWTKNEKSKPNWAFNGDLKNPSFTPSLLNRWGIHVPGYTPPSPEYNEGGICHLHVTNGVIDFSGDCTHDHNDLKGVQMREYDE